LEEEPTGEIGTISLADYRSKGTREPKPRNAQTIRRESNWEAPAEEQAQEQLPEEESGKKRQKSQKSDEKAAKIAKSGKCEISEKKSTAANPDPTKNNGFWKLKKRENLPARKR
jgi:hypothetical protein